MFKMTDILPPRRGRQILSKATPHSFQDLRVRCVGFRQDYPGPILRTFDSHSLMFVTDGEVRLREDQGRESAGAGPCVFTLRANHTYRFGAPEGKTWTYYFLGMSGVGLARLVGSGWFPLGKGITPVPEPNFYVNRFRNMFERLDRGDAFDADHAVLSAFGLLIKTHHLRTQEPGRSSIDAAIRQMKSSFDTDLDLEAVAENHAMSYSSLRQQIRERTGLPPRKFLVKLRCEAAAKLLDETDLTVKQIGAQVGVSDPYVFSKMFRRFWGVSPKQYREPENL